MTVTVFTRSTCGPCKAVKTFLNRKNISFLERNVDEDPKAVDDLLKETGFQMVPLTLINGTPVSGANFTAIASLLENSA